MSTRSLLLVPFLALAACSSHSIPSRTLALQDEAAAMPAPARHAQLSSPVAREAMLPAAPRAEEPSGGPGFAEPRSSLNFLIGARFLDEDQYRPVEDQGVFGLEYAWLPIAGFVGLELGGSLSATEEDVDILGSTFTASGAMAEIYIGGRVEADLGVLPLRVYAGAGPTLLFAAFELENSGSVVDTNDASTGIYAHAGVALDVEGFLLGIDIRGVGGTDVEFYGVERDIDYVQGALLLGISF
jgi:hypothetical protein